MAEKQERLADLYRKRCGLLFGILALVLILCVLFAGDDIGMSNNGDFNRVLAASSLDYGERLPTFTYADTYRIRLDQSSAAGNIASILFGTEGLDRYPSIHILLVRLSVAANLAINKLAGWEVSTYHIAVLGVMYALLYAAGIGLLLSQFRLRRLWQDILVKAAALIVLCDIGYVAYFNSFYGEGPEHIALVFCAAMLVRVLTRKPTAWDGLWCALSAVMYGWAKFFNIPLACLMLLVMEGIVLIRSGRRRVLALAGGGLAILLAVWSVVPGWMDTETNYNAVFYGVVRDVDEATAQRYLRDMGLPEELADYRDTNYYLPGVVSSLEERGLRDEAESVGKGDLLKFYLTHPGRLWQQANLTALHCGMIRPYYMANYGEGYPLMTYSSRMSLWGSLRDWLALDTLAGNLAVAAAFIAAAAAAWRKRTKPLWLILPLAALLGGLAYAFLMPVILNGEGDFAKHMFAYQELLDLVLLATLALALDRAGRGRVGGLVCPVAGGVLALLLLLPPIGQQVSGLWRAGTAHNQPEPGAYVTLGSYGGQPLTWLVTGTENGQLTLLCADSPVSMPFDEGGGNDWRSSSVRSWLNGPFLENFRPEERELLLSGENTVLLTDRFREEAASGYLDFACSHIAVLADRGYDRAYRLTVTDTVTLPDIDLIARLAREGYSVADAPYWLEAPYCRTENLVRYVSGDGHVYFGAAEVSRAIRPVVEISAGAALSGSGSLKDPFRFT